MRSDYPARGSRSWGVRLLHVFPLAGVAVMCLVALLGAGCGSGKAGRTFAADDSIARPEELATEPAAPRLDPDRGRLLSDPAAGPVPRYREWKVPASWKLYDACDQWAAFVDLGKEYGAEPLVLMDVSTGRFRTVLDRATGGSRGLAITAAQVSQGWLVWEESSVHDIELGPVARWRILAAPMSRTGLLGRVREVDGGTVGSRPRCTFRLVGQRLAIGVTEVVRGAGSGASGTDTGSVSGSVSEVRGSAVLVDLPSGARRVVARFPTGVQALSWSQGRLVVVRSRAGAATRALVCVLDERTGGEVSRSEMPPGSTALRRPVVSASRVAFGCGEETGDETLARVCMTDLSGRLLGRSVFGGQDPVLVGGSVIYRLMTRSPPGRGPLRGRLVSADPVTGRQLTLTAPVSTDVGTWLPIVGARYEPSHLWVYFRSVPGTSGGKEEPAARALLRHTVRD